MRSSTTPPATTNAESHSEGCVKPELSKLSSGNNYAGEYVSRLIKPKRLPTLLPINK